MSACMVCSTKVVAIAWLKRHDGEADQGSARSDQQEPQSRAPPDRAAEQHEDQDLGDHAGRPEITDGHVREPLRLPVDAGERVQRSVAALRKSGRDQNDPQDGRQRRGGGPLPGVRRCKSGTDLGTAASGGCNPEERDERQGYRNHPGPEECRPGSRRRYWR